MWTALNICPVNVAFTCCFGASTTFRVAANQRGCDCFYTDDIDPKIQLRRVKGPSRRALRPAPILPLGSSATDRFVVAGDPSRRLGAAR